MIIKKSTVDQFPTTAVTVEMFPHTDEMMDMFPHTGDIHNGVSGHVETVCLLSNRKPKPDTHVKLSLSMDDYEIKESQKY